MVPLKKELILINPPVKNPLVRFGIALVYGIYIPISLHILAALTPKEYKITFLYRKLFWRKKDFTPGVLVGITCVTSSAPHAYRLADRYRQAGAFVVMGGPHASALPEEALAHCHSVVVGEAESVWPQVLRDFERGSLQKMYTGELLEDFFSPVYEYFLSLPPKQLRRAGILVQRGCKYHCEFCAAPAVKLRFVKVEQVVALARRATQGIFLGFLRKPVIIFVGDNLYSSPTHAKQLFRALAEVGIKWVTSSSIDIAFDDEALRLARASGCKMLFIGFETIYPAELAKTSVHQMRTAKDYASAISRIKSHRIAVLGSFIAGFDSYSHRDYLRLLRFLARPMRFLFVNVTMLTPFPGSALYERLLKEGRLKGAGWGAYNLLYILYRPSHLSAFSLFLWFTVIKVVALLLSKLGLLLALLFLNIYYLISSGLLKYLYLFVYILFAP